MKTKHAITLPCLVLAGSFSLVGCGGSSSDSNSPKKATVVTPTPTPVVITPEQMSAKTIEMAKQTLSSQQSGFQLAELAHTIAKIVAEDVRSGSTVCSNGGKIFHKLKDNDSSQTLSTGDDIAVSASDCASNESIYKGALTVHVDALEGESITLSADAKLQVVDLKVRSDYYPIDNFPLPNLPNNVIVSSQPASTTWSAIEGKLSTTQSHLPNMQQQLTVVTTGAGLTLYPDTLDRSVSTQLTDGLSTRLQDQINARYRYDIQAKLKNQDGAWDVNTATALTGFLQGYPDAGRLTLSADKTKANIDANFIINSRLANVTSAQIVGKTRPFAWDLSRSLFVQHSENSVRSQPNRGELIESGSTFPLNLLSVTEASNALTMNTNGQKLLLRGQPTLIYQFDRPLDTSSLGSVTWVDQNYDYPNPPAQFESTLKLNGSLLSITPKTPLPVGQYNLVYRNKQGGSEVIDRTLLRKSFISNERFVISSTQVNVRTSPLLIQTAQTVTLDASSTITPESSGPLSYVWTQISGTPVRLSAADTAQATFVAPTVNTQTTLKFKVVVKNRFAESYSKMVGVEVLPSKINVIAIQSDAGDYIGQGKNVLLTSQKSSINVDNYRQKSNLYISFRDLSNSTFDGFFSINIAAPNGLALGKQTYQATRHPFQNQTSAGFDFSGDGRGCNQSRSTFTISDIAFKPDGEIQRVALDFVQYCENSAAASRGQVIYNAQP